MHNLNGKNILLFCPKFFHYEFEIKKTLEELGANVIWFDDRPSNDFLSKVLIRLDKNLLKKRINKYYAEILSQLKEQNLKLDYLFFVNPEALTKSNLEEFRAFSPSAKCLLYMWDSFRNRKQNIELLPLFDTMFTFDPSDADEYGLNLRPLFYTNDYVSGNNNGDKEVYDLLFIGTAHSDRYLFVKKITSSIGAERLKLYFYLSSKLLFLTKKVLDKDFRNVKYRDISFLSLSHKEIAPLMRQSKAILDINHPKQIGLTMRTLETLGIQRKLITTNSDVKKYDFYDPCNILLIDRENPVIDRDFLKKPTNAYSPEILKKYSIKGWAMEIFELI